MSQLIRSFKGLEAYRVAFPLQQDVLKISKSWPSCADGELAEVHHWIATAFASGCIPEIERNSMLAQWENIGRKLGKIMAGLEKWCPLS